MGWIHQKRATAPAGLLLALAWQAKRSRLRLGTGAAHLEVNAFDASKDVVVPLTVASDRRSVQASFAAGPATAGWNPVCMTASLMGPRGFRQGAPRD